MRYGGVGFSPVQACSTPCSNVLSQPSAHHSSHPVQPPPHHTSPVHHHAPSEENGIYRPVLTLFRTANLTRGSFRCWTMRIPTLRGFRRFPSARARLKSGLTLPFFACHRASLIARQPNPNASCLSSNSSMQPRCEISDAWCCNESIHLTN
jgi:hypothetical protein